MFKITVTEELKEKLIRWADSNFEQICVLDSNNYKDPLSEIQWELSFSAIRKIELQSTDNAFDLLKEFYNSSNKKLYGFFSYDLKNDVEKLVSNHNPEIDFPELFFYEAEHVISQIDDQLISETFDFSILPEHIDISSTSSSNQQSLEIKQHCTKSEYIETIKKLKEHIYNGDIYEINYCIPFSVYNFNKDLISTYFKLNQLSPNPFTCLLKNNSQYIVSASPERFLRLKANKLYSQPIKGTKKRSSNIEKDREELLNDEKERAENVMIVDLVRNDLKKVAIKGSIQVDELFGIYTFPQLHQMISTISAQANPNLHVVDYIKSCFPMGSMTGAPKLRAMQLIEQYEVFRRSAFSGALGYFDLNHGNFDFNVLIRSLFIDKKTQSLTFSVGSAITYDSIAEKEYDECLLKSSAIQKILN